MYYHLNFFDQTGLRIRALDIEEPDKDAAIDRCSNESRQSNMTVDLWRADEFIIRMTPMIALLYDCELPEQHHY
jgi:hypothetical protein